ncbi:cation:dicarboxylate symporter family transporter [Dickeya solani]|uniref:Cation:dicarboxylase symporter family transporter n=1 Tax=Dickeya solani TaxID=1089444 RepID=A0ABU4ELD2_9GAMM|nr:cation:dicarboxylase symporter family transporter [Dickeya solani]MCA6999723.1 cation:dicarboxylase symporter family transporter [Dickeya solani]MCZ0820332.1 cation:dicarboxylase symporter family transporter [Dickeya solani]MDV6993934.1 cation:dicarboxylase symporter family transporter [Dickeya solani]MDV7005290.1 cation:dicarboxylase symporter family transporter [Dickeya solani]MDV7039107.1 cation:dicarboxylase symporter family transporter [Dickeya solani]
MPKISLLWQIVIGLFLGICIGLFLNQHQEYSHWIIEQVLQPAGDIFIKLMKMIVIPIVFSCLIVGIAGHGDSKSMGRLGIKTITYFLSVTTIAILCGLVVGNVIKPGEGVDMSSVVKTPVSGIGGTAAHGHGLGQVILGIIPDNIVSAMASGNLLPVIFFAVIFSLGLTAVEKSKKETIITVFSGIADAMFRVTSMIMAYSPIGIFGMMGVTVSTFGAASLLPLVKLIVTTYITALLFVLVIFGLIARFSGINIFSLIKFIRSELVLAFSSASSASVLPQIMQKVERFGADKSITSFVVPTGYSFNLDGASLFLGIGTLFIAQIYNIHLSLSDQLVLVATMVITSKGAAGVPGFMFVILSATLSSVGIPLEGIAFIAGVYRLMDMPNTALNVLGNALAPLVIAKWESKFDAQRHQQALTSR